MAFFKEVRKFFRNPIGYIMNASRTPEGEAIAGVAASSGVPVVSWIGKSMLNYDAKQDALEQQQKEMEWQQKEAEKNREFQREERVAAQDFAVERYEVEKQDTQERLEEQREYDSLSSQVQRAYDAGLSPSAVVDGGKGSAPVTNSTPSVGPIPSGSAASVPSSLAPSLLTSDAQVANLMSQTDKNNSESQLNKQTYDWNAKTAGVRLEDMKKGLQLKDAQIKEMCARAQLSDAETKQIETLLPYIVNEKVENINIQKQQLINMRADYLQILEEVSNLRVQRQNLRKQGVFIDAQTNLANSQAALADSQVELNEQQKKLLKIEETLQDLNVKLLQQRYDFSKVTGIPFDTPEYQIAWKLYGTGDYNKFLNILQEVVDSSTPTANKVSTGVGIVDTVVDWFGGSNGNNGHKSNSNRKPKGRVKTVPINPRFLADEVKFGNPKLPWHHQDYYYNPSSRLIL